MINDQLYVIIAFILLIAGIFNVVLSYFIWKKYWIKQRVAPALMAILILLASALWMFVTIFQLFISDKYINYNLEKMGYLGVNFIGSAWLVLALKWTGREKWLSNRNLILLFSIPVLFCLLILTNDFHNLIFLSYNPVSISPSFSINSYEYTYIWYFFTLIIYVLIFIGIFFLIMGFLAVRHVYKKHAFILLLGTLAPFIANIIYNAFLIDIIYIDLTPLFFLITGLVYYWGFSRLKLIDVIPVAKEAVFDNLKDPVFVLDSRDRVVDFNPAAVNVFNLKDSSSFIGEKLEDFVDDKDFVSKVFNDSSKGEVVLYVGGEKRFYDMNVDVLRSGKGDFTGRVVSLRDITDLKCVQDELRFLNENLERQVDERTGEIKSLLEHKIEFIGHLGHDLKTPLTPLVGLLPVIKGKISDSSVLELVDVMERNVLFMRDLVGKTLSFEKLNTPGVELTVADLNVYSEVEKNIGRKKTVFDEKNIKVLNQIDEAVFVKADVLLFHELVDNILSNAIKYIDKPNGKIIIKSELKKDMVKVSFEDNGIGLSSEQIEHVFEEFYKVDPSRHELDSSGLGLSICKGIVEKHGGRIWVESLGIENGSIFSFTLPLKDK